jgi:hypothetical protein
MEVIRRYRGGLPAPITAEVLARAGISDSLIPRTLTALQTLDLINEDGSATPTLEGLRRCPEAEFQQRLTDWLNVAYADVRNFVDPASADETAIRDAFRPYNPVAQQPRMVSLFNGLYSAAGVRKTTDKTPTPKPVLLGKPRIRSVVVSQPSKPKGKQWSPTQREQAMASTGGLPPALAGLMASLPTNGKGWTKATRDQFVALFGATLDFCIPVVTQEELEHSDMAVGEECVRGHQTKSAAVVGHRSPIPAGHAR